MAYTNNPIAMLYAASVDSQRVRQNFDPQFFPYVWFSMMFTALVRSALLLVKTLYWNGAVEVTEGEPDRLSWIAIAVGAFLAWVFLVRHYEKTRADFIWLPRIDTHPRRILVLLSTAGPAVGGLWLSFRYPIICWIAFGVFFASVHLVSLRIKSHR